MMGFTPGTHCLMYSTLRSRFRDANFYVPFRIRSFKVAVNHENEQEGLFLRGIKPGDCLSGLQGQGTAKLGDNPVGKVTF